MSIKKIFFFFFISTSFCFAVFNDKIIENIYIKNNQIDKKITYFKNKKLKSYEAKVILNKNLEKNKILYLQIFCDVNNIIKSNFDYIKKEEDTIIVKINTNKINDLIFSFSFLEKKEINFSVNNMSKFEFESLFKYRNLILGFSFGIVFSAFLYNLILYFNTFYKAFLYYSVMQFFLFSVIINLQNFIQETYKYTLDALLTELSATLVILFLLLFSKEILELHKNTLINKVFNALIFINILDATLIFINNNSYLYDILNRSAIVIMILLTSIYYSFKFKKDAILFVFGWLVILITLAVVEFDLTYISDNLIYAVGLPLEALLLSFALGYRLKNIIKEKENLLIQQHKLASMGEMLNNIAHQWKQPLANLSFMNMDLKLAIRKDEIKKEYLEQMAVDSNKQLKFMANTLDNFKGFYQPNKEKENFLHSKTLKKAIEIIKPSLKNTKIKVQLEIINDSFLYSYENEYIQVILNILNNSKEAFSHNKIENPYIKITINKNILSIEDNAGGIKKEIINKIFDPYFSTKHKNSGIGLYMSKVILDSHLKGDIEVQSKNKKTKFIIKL